MRIVLAALFLVYLFTWGLQADDLQRRARYTLRVGDVLNVEYRYTPELNQTVTVSPDGYVSLNLVGDVKVGELTVEQAHAKIIEKASERLNNPEVNLVLEQFQNPYVVVSGEVGKPGQLTFGGNLTAMQAVLAAGGFLESAQTSQVLLYRKIDTSDRAEVRVLNLKNLRKTSDLERDVQLQPGDMLFIPRNKIQNIARFVKAFNAGSYVNPLQTLH